MKPHSVLDTQYATESQSSQRRINKGVKLIGNDPELERKAQKLLWFFVIPNEVKPFALSNNDGFWPETVSLADRMEMKKPNFVQFTSAKMGDFLWEFVCKVKRKYEKQTCEMISAERARKLDMASTTIPDIRFSIMFSYLSL